MLDGLTYEQREMEKAIIQLCERYLNRDVFPEEEKEFFNREKWRRIGEMGIFALPFSREIKGLGVDMMTTALAIRKMAQSCKDEGIVFSVIAQMAAMQIPISLYGTPSQIKEYLYPMMWGDKIGSSVITEPDAGSDSGGMLTSVIRCQNEKELEKEFFLNGVKTFATLAPVSDFLLVYGKHPQGIHMLDVSAFLLKHGEYQIGQIYSKIGLRTSPMSEVLIDHMKISEDRMLGKERKAMNIFMDAMLWEKMLVAAYHVGAMEQQYEEVFYYANHRRQFKTKIIQFDAISDLIITMRINIETSRLMLFEMCGYFDQGNLRKSQAAMLKLHTSKAKLENSNHAVEVLGAYGIVKESLIEKQVRDSLLAGIYSGTAQMQKKLMFNDLGRLYD